MNENIKVDHEFIATWYDYYTSFIGAKVRWVRGDFGEEIDLPIEIETIDRISWDGGFDGVNEPVFLNKEGDRWMTLDYVKQNFIGENDNEF